jgi:hypothetical protein
MVNRFLRSRSALGGRYLDPARDPGDAQYSSPARRRRSKSATAIVSPAQAATKQSATATKPFSVRDENSRKPTAGDSADVQTMGIGHVGIYHQPCLPPVLQEIFDRHAKAQVEHRGGRLMPDVGSNQSCVHRRLQSGLPTGVLRSVVMLEAVTVFFGIMSAGIFIAHAIDGYRSSL